MLSVELAARSGEAAKSGPLGLAIILAFCVVCYFLFKSMSKHLRTVREKFPTDPAATEQQPAQPADVVRPAERHVERPVDIVKREQDRPH